MNGGSTSVGSIHYDLSLKTGNFDSQVSQINSKLNGLVNGLKVLATGLVAREVVQFGMSAVKAFNESEEAIAQTNAVLKSTKGIAGVTADKVQELASAFQKTTKFSDETVRSGENLLLTFTAIGKDIFPEATAVMLDMSQALGQDVKSSAIQLGKALQDPILGVTALRRVGVNFSEAQQDMIKSLVESGKQLEAQKFILKELQVEFGGSAKAAGETFGGKLAILKNRFNDLQETIGRWLVDTIMRLLPVLERWKNNIVEIARVVYQFLKPSIDALINTFKNDLLPLIRDQWAKHGEEFKRLIKELAIALGVTIVAALWLLINVLTAAITVWTAVGTAVTWVSERVMSFWHIITGVFSTLSGAIAAAGAGIYNAIVSPFMRAWDWIAGLPGRIVGAIGNVGKLLRDKIGDWDIPGPLGKVRDVIPGFARGGFTGIGGANEIAGVVHKGEYVVPRNQVDQSTGRPFGGGITINIGTINDRSDVDYLMRRLDRSQEMVSLGVSP